MKWLMPRQRLNKSLILPQLFWKKHFVLYLFLYSEVKMNNNKHKTGIEKTSNHIDEI